MRIHKTRHPGAGKKFTVNLRSTSVAAQQDAIFHLEDYWDRVGGGSWIYATGNPAAQKYGFRVCVTGLPIDDEVVVGKIGGLTHLVHVSELGAEIKPVK